MSWALEERHGTRGEECEVEPFHACFGVGCPQHSRCARYAAVDSSQASTKTIGTCFDGRLYPLFLEVGEASEAMRVVQL